MSVRAVRECVSARRELLEYADENPDDIEARRQLLDLIEHAISDANARIHSYLGERGRVSHGMGTTCSLLLLTGKRGFIAHVETRASI